MAAGQFKLSRCFFAEKFCQWYFEAFKNAGLDKKNQMDLSC